MEELVRRVQALGAQTILMLTSHRAQPEKEAELQPYLTAMRNVARINRLPLAGANALFKVWEQEGKTVLGPDGLHHGPDGFPAMARAFLNGLGLEELPLVEEVTPWPGALTTWDISEPVVLTDSAQFALAPLEQAEGWKNFDAKAVRSILPWHDQPLIDRGAVFPLAGIMQTDTAKLCAFARVIHNAPESGEARLQVGGSAPMQVYLNGQQVWSQTGAHGYHPNADCMIITLTKGRNEIVVCSTWMAFLSLRPVLGATDKTSLCGRDGCKNSPET